MSEADLISGQDEIQTEKQSKSNSPRNNKISDESTQDLFF
jgi:hypothetical protein